MKTTTRLLRHRQRGIATILIILFTGLSLSVAVLALIYRISGTQEKSTTLHAQTQAQIKAWTGADVVNRYLTALLQNEIDGNGQATLTAFATQASETPAALAIAGIDGITATVVSANTAAQQIVVDIAGATAEHTRAEAHSTLRVVYQWSGSVTPPSSGGSTEGAVNFNRNLNLGGSIKIVGDGTKQYTINVKGDVTTGGNSITGVDVINSTGSISIGSGSSFDILRANGDVKLTGSVSGEQNIEAKGNVCLSGGASALGTVHANGTVVGDGGVQFGDISSRGTSTNTGTALCGTIGTDARGAPWGIDLQGNSSAQSATTPASIRVNSGSIGAVLAGGDLRDTNWGGTEYGRIGGNLLISGSNPAIAGWITVVPGLSVSVPPVSDVVLETETFNAYNVESAANYAFKMIDGYKRVHVSRVEGLADGDYFLFDDSSGPYRDYLCPLAQRSPNSTASSPRCSIGAASLTTICRGYSAYNTCFSYSNGTWTIAGTSMAQGVVWFEGNLTVSNGTYFNTFIATGNLNTGGSLTLYAPNYAGYSGAVDGVTYAPTGICANSNFSALKPRQFCSGSNFLYTADDGIGNYAMLAGSCTTSACSTYVGGNIALGSSNNIYGSVKAGNEFSSGGSTMVAGFISALAQGAQVQNSMGGSTTIRLTGLPPGYSPAAGTSGNSGGNAGGSTGTEPTLSIRWSRYL